ncbi:MAG TPA: HAD family hydrolase [Candidatus Norongarragalinales archaeon]|nr:HAD family hydrolase [Candidatus Norongarragalinales archaeon]
MKPKKGIFSFDLDGTLIDKNFDDAIWLEELPKLYSRQNGTTMEKAKEIFFAEYRKIGPNRLEWYDVGHWFEKMGLDVSARKVVEDLKHRILLYPDVLPALRRLKKSGTRMVVFTNSPRMFTEIKIKAERLESFFEKIVCVPTDYRKVKGHDGAFERFAGELGVTTGDITHVGDSYEIDYLPALKAGCKAILIERTDATPTLASTKDARKISSLEELGEIL